MKTNHVTAALNSMVKGLQTTIQAPVKLNSVEATSNSGYARIVATVAQSAAKDSAQAINAICAHINHKMRPVAGSFTVLASDDVNVTLTGIMTANPETIAYHEGIEGFKAVAGNMFLDQSEHVWSLQKSEAGDLLIRARTREDEEVIGEVMQSVSSAVQTGTSAHVALKNYASLSSQLDSVEGGDFAIYVNPRTESVVFGAIAAAVVDPESGESTDLCVVASGDTDHAVIDRRLLIGIVEASEVEVDDSDLVQESVSANGHSLDDIISYYSRMFQRDPAYFEKFMSRWKSHTFG